jgi:hypothetical protein
MRFEENKPKTGIRLPYAVHAFVAQKKLKAIPIRDGFLYSQ